MRTEGLVVVSKEHSLAECHVAAPSGKGAERERNAKHSDHSLKEVVLTETPYEPHATLKHHRAYHNIRLLTELPYQGIQPVSRCWNTVGRGGHDDIIVSSLDPKQERKLAMTHRAHLIGDLRMKQILASLFHDRQHIKSFIG